VLPNDKQEVVARARTHTFSEDYPSMESTLVSACAHADMAASSTNTHITAVVAQQNNSASQQSSPLVQLHLTRTATHQTSNNHMAHASSVMDDAIKEYLLFRGFTSSFRAFENDLRNDKDKAFQVSQCLHALCATDAFSAYSCLLFCAGDCFVR
jgi:hypothetical protein